MPMCCCVFRMGANEWEAWAKEHTRKVTKLSNRMINKLWWSVVLDCAPYVKID